jgi:LemA protein
MIGVTVFSAMTVLLAGYALALYRGLLRAERQLRRAWSHLEFAWARRDGEITRLLELCAPDATAHSEVLERLQRARGALQLARDRRDAPAVNAAERELRSVLAALYPLAARNVHAHPQGDALLRALRFRVRAHERAIAAHAERYNAAAEALNARIDLLPDALIAAVCHLVPVARVDLNPAGGADGELSLAYGK